MTTPQVLIDICNSNSSFFTNSLSNDAVIRTTSSNQRLMLGTKSNAIASVIVSSNSVGIGTTNTPLRTLDVGGDIVLSKYGTVLGINAYKNGSTWYTAENSYNGFAISSSNNVTSFVHLSSNSASNTPFAISSEGILNIMHKYIVEGSNGSVTIGLDESNVFRFTQSNVSDVLTLQNGNVGFGLSNPLYKIDVAGQTRLSSSNTALNIDGNDKRVDMTIKNNVSSGIQVGVAFAPGDYSSDSQQGDCIIKAVSNSNKVIIQTGSNNSAICVSGDNNIGVGNSNPLYKLDIGNGSSDTSSKMRFNTADGDKMLLTYDQYATKVAVSNHQFGIYAGKSNTGVPGAVVFYTQSNHKESLRIDHHGYVGVGTSNPGYLLDVSGDINFSGILKQNGQEFISGTPGLCNGTGTIFTTCNIGINTSNPVYDLDVNGDINFTGNILNNGFVFLNGGLSSNFNFVKRFQVLPVNKSFMITTESQSNFLLTTDGNVIANPENVFITLNGIKLAYVDSSNNDFTLNITKPTFYTTRFEINLIQPTLIGDVVDITVFPYIDNANGVFIETDSVNFTSNLNFSNVVIGPSNITSTSPLYVYNEGLSNWLSEYQNSNTFVRLTSAYGAALMVQGDHTMSNNPAFHCTNGHSNIMYARNDGYVGIGTSNPSSTLHVAGNTTLKGHLIPETTLTYDLGTSNNRFRDLFLSGNTIDIGGTKISVDTSNNVQFLDNQSNLKKIIIDELQFGIANPITLKKDSTTGAVKFVQTSGGQDVETATSGWFTSNNIVYILNSNIGIGTSNPSTQLEVNGSAKINSNLEVSKDLNVQGNLTVAGNTFVVNTDIVEVRDNIIVLNSGQVGSGVSAGTAGITIDRGDAPDFQILFNETTDKFEMGEVGNLIPIASEAYVNAQTLGGTSGWITSNNIVYILNSNVGVGISNPSTELQINGSVKINSNLEVSKDLTVVNGSISGSGSGITNINADNISSGTLPVLRGGTGTTTSTGTGSNVLNTDPTFQGTVTLPMTTVNGNLTSTGNIGIGISNPTESLHVVGKTFTTNQILGFTGDSSNVPAYSWTDDSNTGMYHPGSDTMAFVTGASERIRLTSTGRIGVGTTNPGSLLAVAGGATMGTAYSNVVAPTNGLIVQGNVGIGISNPSSKLHVSGDIYATSDITAFSDQRFKTNIERIPDALQKVIAINGYTFNVKDPETGVIGTRKHTGVIAQELREVLPEAVTESDDGVLGVAYGNIAGLFIEAIKEINAKLESSTNYIHKLEERIIELEKN